MVDLLRHYVYEDSDYVPKNVYESTRTGSKVTPEACRVQQSFLYRDKFSSLINRVILLRVFLEAIGVLLGNS